MGLSFYDETSLVEAVSTLRFNEPVDDPNPILGTGSISQDGNLCVGLDNDNPNAGPQMVNISQERRDDDIGGSDGIQIVYR